MLQMSIGRVIATGLAVKVAAAVAVVAGLVAPTSAVAREVQRPHRESWRTDRP